MEMLRQRVSATLNTRECREVVANSGESVFEESVGADLMPLGKLWKELGCDRGSKKKDEDVDLEVFKAEMLMLAHLHRRAEVLNAQLAADLENVLPKWRLVSQA